MRERAIVPDLVFGLALADGSRRYFMVEIDRGTMPIVRSDLMQTSFEQKMRAYLTAHAAKQHERQFGWKTFPRAHRHDRPSPHAIDDGGAALLSVFPTAPVPACSYSRPPTSCAPAIRSRTRGAMATAAMFVWARCA